MVDVIRCHLKIPRDPQIRFVRATTHGRRERLPSRIGVHPGNWLAHSTLIISQINSTSITCAPRIVISHREEESTTLAEKAMQKFIVSITPRVTTFTKNTGERKSKTTGEILGCKLVRHLPQLFKRYVCAILPPIDVTPRPASYRTPH